MMLSLKSKRLYVLFLAALILRLTFSLIYWTDKPITHDAEEYILLAERLTDEGKFGYEINPGDTTEHHERAPVYPVFLAAIFFIFGNNLVIVKIVQSVICALLPLIMFGITRRLFSQRSALIAAWIIVFYPPLLWGSAEFLAETLFTVVAMYAFYLLILFSESQKNKILIASALLFVTAAHIKPVMLMALPLLAMWLWLRTERKNSLGLKEAIIFSAAVLLLLVPWTIRNYMESDKFILIASEGGITFWTGNHPLAVGDGDMAANPQIGRDNKGLRRKHGYPPPSELEEIYYQEALRFIRENPVKFIGLLFKKAFYFWFPVGRSMALFSLRHQAASHLSYFPILLLAIFATFKLLKTNKAPTLPYLSILGALIACMIFFPQERYRIPLTDPFLIVLASYYISEKAKFIHFGKHQDAGNSD